MAPREIIVVGRFGAPYGIKGWIRLRSFTDPAERLLDYRPWYLEDETGWRNVSFAEARPHRGGFIIRLEESENRAAAQLLSGRAIGIREDQLPPTEPDEYYWKDLIGLEVRDPQGRSLGRVQGLTQTGAHDVLVLRPDASQRTHVEKAEQDKAEQEKAEQEQVGKDNIGREKRELLIPFVRDIVIEVDLERGRLIADWDPDF